MKKIVFIFVILLVAGFASEVFAEPLFVTYNTSTKCLSVEYINTKYPTWGCNDVEMVQWDRLVLDALGKPQIYLEVYGVGQARLTVYQLALSERIVILGNICNVPCDAEFQIKALVWKNNQQVWAYWPLGPGEPVRADISAIGIDVIKTCFNDYIFRTSCDCP